MVVEVWRPLEDFPRYEVSSFGRVRNAETGRTLRREITPAGYARVRLLNKYGEYVKVYIHQLVYGTIIDPGYVYGRIRHLDGDTLNNCADNLVLWKCRESWENFTDDDYDFYEYFY